MFRVWRCALVAALVTFTSCGDSASTTGPEETQDRADKTKTDDGAQQTGQTGLTPGELRRFEATYDEVVTLLRQQRYDELEAYVDPDCGIYKLFNPGVMPVLRASESFDADFVEGDLPTLGVIEHDCTLQHAAMPEYSCAQDAWEKEGCFSAEVSGYDQLSRTYQLFHEVGGGQIDGDFLQRLRRCEAMVSRGMVNTQDIYKLYFHQADGSWFLTVIDLITPCDA